MPYSRSLLLLVPTAILCASIAGFTQSGAPPVKRESFGKMPDGAAVEIFTLRNAAGMEVRAISYGGINVMWVGMPAAVSSPIEVR